MLLSALGALICLACAVDLHARQARPFAAAFCFGLAITLGLPAFAAWGV